MNSTIGRYLYKAQWTLWNAELGSFPNATKVTAVEKPFGAKQHKEFVEATSKKGEQTSPWRTWLLSQYHDELVSRIRMKNRIHGVAAIEGVQNFV